jgi:hypothetical protein
VDLHSVDEPRWNISSLGLSDDEIVIQGHVRDVPSDWYDADEEIPSESEATDVETFVEVMCASLYGFQNSGISF